MHPLIALGGFRLEVNVVIAGVLDAVGHIPTLADSPLVDVMRTVCVISSGLMLLPMLMVARRTHNVGFYALAIFMFTSAIGEADQLGRPFIVYQLPLRLLGVVLAGYWLWKRRDSSTA